MKTLCPCESGLAYPRCCERWHRGALHLQAPNAEALMRSRYSAFVLDELQYLLDTWHPDTRPTHLEPNPKSLKWLGLHIKHRSQQDETHATVEFVARSRHDGHANRMHETSQFIRIDGRWFYLDGKQHNALD